MSFIPPVTAGRVAGSIRPAINRRAIKQHPIHRVKSLFSSQIHPALLGSAAIHRREIPAFFISLRPAPGDLSDVALTVLSEADGWIDFTQ